MSGRNLYSTFKEPKKLSNNPRENAVTSISLSKQGRKHWPLCHSPTKTKTRQHPTAHNMLVRLRFTTRVPVQPTRSISISQPRNTLSSAHWPITHASTARIRTPPTFRSFCTTPATPYVEKIQNLCANMDLKRAQREYQKMLENGIQPTVEVFNALLEGYEQLHDPKQFVSVWQEMAAKGVAPNANSYASYMRLALEKSFYKKVEQVYEALQQAGLQPNEEVYAVLMRMEGQGGFVEDAQDLLEEMKSKGLKPDERHYRAIMQAQLLQSQVDDAKATLERMRAEGVEPTPATYHLFMKSFASAKKYADVVDWYERFLGSPLAKQGVPGALSILGLEAASALRDKELSSRYKQIMDTAMFVETRELENMAMKVQL